MSFGGFVRGKTPEGRNPKSVTCLKMAGRLLEGKTAERLKKPVSGTETDGLGSVGTIRKSGFHQGNPMKRELR